MDDEKCATTENTDGSRASSYYLLYKLNSPRTIKQCQQQQPWEPDVWTPQCKRDAQKLLLRFQPISTITSRYEIQQLDMHADKFWNMFYERHENRFFKDRHYLQVEFPNDFHVTNYHCCDFLLVVEIGCGVGNALLPLLERSNIQVCGLDFSSHAISILKQDSRFVEAWKEKRAMAHVWDMTESSTDNNDCTRVMKNKSNVALLLFALSAVSPCKMSQAVKNASSLLQPGNGVLLFRDYGQYDQAQLKLGTQRGKRLGQDNFYVKSDGTRSYYFTLEDVTRLFCDDAGLEVLEVKYITRIYRNRQDNSVRRRVWVQGRFRKPF